MGVQTSGQGSTILSGYLLETDGWKENRIWNGFILVDGSVIIRKVGKRILSDLGFLVNEAQDARDAMDLCEGGLPAILVVDSCMDDATGLIRQVRGMPGGDAVKIYYCLIEGKLKTMMQGKRAGGR